MKQNEKEEEPYIKLRTTSLSTSPLGSSIFSILRKSTPAVCCAEVIISALVGPTLSIRTGFPSSSACFRSLGTKWEVSSQPCTQNKKQPLPKCGVSCECCSYYKQAICDFDILVSVPYQLPKNNQATRNMKPTIAL